MKQRSQFDMGDALLLMALVSMLCQITFSLSGISILCFFGVFFLISCFCIKRRIMPEICGALLGFAGPGMLGLFFIGELWLPPEPGVYRETEINFLIAIFCIVFLGGLGAMFGAAFGSLFGMIVEIIRLDLIPATPDE